MKNKFKSFITVLLITIGVFTLTACGKSLDKTLIDGTGTWQCTLSNGDNIKINFFDNGESRIEDEKGTYKVDGKDINFMDDKGKIITSIKDTKIEGDTIKGTLTSINSSKKSEIIMNKVK
ncbi:TPA: hypothetical protein PL519_003442 [Clostridium botulinum]|nr:hypothetical protein [Clostridium botulinum]